MARRMPPPAAPGAWEQKARPARAEKLPVGTRVFHEKFGYGKVLAVDDDKLDVMFDKAGQKKLLDRFVERA
jgi:DNA helicase-2/ATP-dependent DNA helicase PcrA